jgi:hypothetical protein
VGCLKRKNERREWPSSFFLVFEVSWQNILFYVCSVFHNVSEESVVIERLQRITKEEKAHQVAK